MHTMHRRGQVCASARAAELPIESVIGLTLHEVGHHLAELVWGSSEQNEADAVVAKLLGVRIMYAGPLLIQRVSASVAARILGGRR